MMLFINGDNSESYTDYIQEKNIYDEPDNSYFERTNYPILKMNATLI